MSPILSKAQMTEEDIKLQYITPAITAKWSKNLITMETKITDMFLRTNQKQCFVHFHPLPSNTASLPSWKNCYRCARN